LLQKKPALQRLPNISGRRVSYVQNAVMTQHVSSQHADLFFSESRYQVTQKLYRQEKKSHRYDQ
jgi:hypothetical protein